MAIQRTILILAAVCLAYAEVDLITEPKPGQEYVFLQTSGAGSRPIERKEKATENERVFETAHKLPPSLTFALNSAEDDEVKSSKPHKRQVPAGAIKLDPLRLIEMYKDQLKTTTKATPNNKSSKRTKKEAKYDVTTPNSILTTGAPVRRFIDTDDIPLVAAGSEKQRSRIQVKKGPNGQEYEYEYVYYYYDDEDEKTDGKVSNSHDGPARNEITQKPSRGRGTTAAPEPAVNEVLPTGRSRSRGRQLDNADSVSEERLPANTRFPPRSRNLNTTPLPEEEEEKEVKPTRSRTRGRPTTEAPADTDSVSDETQGSRRTRPDNRRPSLIDNETFNTHTTASEPPSASGPSFPSDLPAGPVRFLGATPNEKSDLPEAEKPVKENEEDEEEEEDKPEETAAPAVNDDDVEAETPATETIAPEDITTMMSPMDKMALYLYAVSKGTEDNEETTEPITDMDMDMETTTFEMTTEVPTTEMPTTTPTPTTTTTTTTTTTPAPTTTVASGPVFGRGRNRNRGLTGKKTTQAAAAATTEATQETKPKGRFGRPSFGNRPKPGARTTTASPESHDEAQKEDSKPVGHARPTIGRSRFGTSRTRQTTAAPSESSDDSGSASSAAPARPSLRPRPTFNLRTRGRTTAAPSGDGESAAPAEEGAPEVASTTAKPRARIGATGNVRPLRPGPRLNLGGRGRLGATTPSTEAPAEPTAAVDEEEAPKEEQTSEKEAEATPAPDTSNPLTRLRNKQRPSLQVRPKAAASAPVQVRRVNPLLARRRPGVTQEPSTEAPKEEPSTEASEEPEDEEGDEEAEAPAPSSTTTTEEPKGLNKLLAARRRLPHRQPGTLA